MAETPARMRQLQATEAEWVAADPTLLDGEIAFSSDVMRYKVGPGVWSSLSYWGDPDSPDDGHPYGIEDGNWVRTSRYQDFTGDLDTITAPGITHYRLVNPITNAWPDYNAVGGSFITHHEYDAANAVQVGYAFNAVNEATHVLYQRVRRNGVWGTWYTNPGYNPVPATGDLNTLAQDGTFEISMPLANGVTNAWPNAGFGDVITHTNIDNVTAMQVGYELRVAGQPQIWMRSLNAGVWSEWYENKFGFEVFEADIVDLNRIRWRNVWVGGTQYVKNDMVVSAGYLAVANTDTTASPVPAESGDPIYQLPTVPSWANQTHTGVVEAGNRYTVPASVLLRITQYRFWVPTGAALPDYKYALYLTNVTDPDNPITSIIASFDGSQLVEGWNSFDNTDSTLLTEGTSFGIYLQSFNSASDSQWAAQWTRAANSNAGAPAVGEWLTNNGNSQIRFNVTDSGSNNQTTNLALVTVGSDIAVFDTADGGTNIYQNYRVTNVTDNGTWYQFDVIPLDTGPGGAPAVGAATTGNFTIPVVGSTPYVTIADYFLANPNIIGIISLSGGALVEDEAAYNVDIQFQQLIASDDWDIAAISAGGALGGGGGSGPGGGAAVWYGDTEPVDAVVGDLWYRSVDPTGLFLKTDDGDSEQWVQTNGINIAGDFVERGGDTMTGNLLVPEALADSHVPTFGQVKGEIATTVGNYVPAAGGTFTGNINFEGEVNVTDRLHIKNDPNGPYPNDAGILWFDDDDKFRQYLFWREDLTQLQLNVYDANETFLGGVFNVNETERFFNVTSGVLTVRSDVNSIVGNPYFQFYIGDTLQMSWNVAYGVDNDHQSNIALYSKVGNHQSTIELHHLSEGFNRITAGEFYANGTGGVRTSRYWGADAGFAAFIQNRNGGETHFGDLGFVQLAGGGGGPVGVYLGCNNSGNLSTFGVNMDFTSDIRTKDAVKVSQTDALADIAGLNPIQWDYNELAPQLGIVTPAPQADRPENQGVAKRERDTRKHHVDLGFTSDQLRAIAPDAVYKTEDGIDRVDYRLLVPHCLRAIQQLTEKIEELEGRIDGN